MLKKYISFIILVVAILGCSREAKEVRSGDPDFVFLSVRMSVEQFDPVKGMPSDLGELSIYINGNFWSHVVNNRTGPIDKYLFDGTNALSVSGQSAGIVEINLLSAPRYGEKISNEIFSEVVKSNRDGRINVEHEFSVKRPTSLSYTLEDIDLLDRSDVKSELKSIVNDIYEYCAKGNKREFINVTLAGYRLYSPVAYSSVSSATGRAFDYFDLAPFPEKLNYIFGKKLVTVYSGKDSNESLIIFSDKTNKFGAVSSLTFARIKGKWIVW